MKKMLLSLGAAALFAFTGAALRAAQQDWPSSLDPAFASAKASQTLVFAEFHSDT